MSPSGPRAVEIVLSGEEHAELSRWAAGAVSPKLAERARIVLVCAEGVSNAAVAAEFGVTSATVAKWRGRFAVRRLAGLADEPRAGRPKAGLVLTGAEWAELTRWARRAKTAQLLALRAETVLRCAEGGTNRQVAAERRGGPGPWLPGKSSSTRQRRQTALTSADIGWGSGGAG